MFKPGDLVKFDPNGWWHEHPDQYCYFYYPDCKKIAGLFLNSVWEVIKVDTARFGLHLLPLGFLAQFNVEDFVLYNDKT